MAVKQNNTKSKETASLRNNTFPNLLDKLPFDRKRWSSVRLGKRGYLVLLVIGLIILGLWKKEWFVAATVNGSPISNIQLLSEMNKQYRTQTLNQMINEKLILDTARKQNTIITSGEIDAKIDEIIKNVGGREAFEGLLAQQNLTIDSLRNQIKLQLTVEKLYANEATVSAEEVNQFLEQNVSLLTATESAAQRKEAEDLLKQQKVSQVFSEKFQELKQQANIKIF